MTATGPTTPASSSACACCPRTARLPLLNAILGLARPRHPRTIQPSPSNFTATQVSHLLSPLFQRHHLPRLLLRLTGNHPRLVECQDRYAHEQTPAELEPPRRLNVLPISDGPGVDRQQARLDTDAGRDARLGVSLATRCARVQIRDRLTCKQTWKSAPTTPAIDADAAVIIVMLSSARSARQQIGVLT